MAILQSFVTRIAMSLAPFLNCAQVAELLECSEKTVQIHARSGELPGLKFGEDWIFPSEALLERLNSVALERANERRQDKPKPLGLVMAQTVPRRGGRRRNPIPALPSLS